MFRINGVLWRWWNKSKIDIGNHIRSNARLKGSAWSRNYPGSDEIQDRGRYYLEKEPSAGTWRIVKETVREGGINAIETIFSDLDRTQGIVLLSLAEKRDRGGFLNQSYTIWPDTGDDGASKARRDLCKLNVFKAANEKMGCSCEVGFSAPDEKGVPTHYWREFRLKIDLSLGVWKISETTRPKDGISGHESRVLDCGPYRFPREVPALRERFIEKTAENAASIVEEHGNIFVPIEGKDSGVEEFIAHLERKEQKEAHPSLTDMQVKRTIAEIMDVRGGSFVGCSYTDEFGIRREYWLQKNRRNGCGMKDAWCLTKYGWRGKEQNPMSSRKVADFRYPENGLLNMAWLAADIGWIMNKQAAKTSPWHEFSKGPETEFNSVPSILESVRKDLQRRSGEKNPLDSGAAFRL